MTATLSLSTQSHVVFPHITQPSRARSAPCRTVHFFLDFSNIALGAAEIAPLHGDGVVGSRHLRLHANNLRKLVQRDRIWQSGYGAAAFPGNGKCLCRHFSHAGIDLRPYEPGGVSGREQGIDEIIQCQMLRLIGGTERGVVVLATGDGNGHRQGNGFLPTLRLLHEHGFPIEVMSWSHSFNSTLREWASINGTAIELDAWYLERA